MTYTIEAVQAPSPSAPTPRADAPALKRGRLGVANLSVGFRRNGILHQVVHDVSFSLEPGQCVAIVGESGSGKSVTARSIVGLAGTNSVVDAQSILLDGDDLRTATKRQWRQIRGRRIGFILQDALVSLDPLRPVGKEIAEALALHGWGSRRRRAAKVIDLLRAVGVPSPENRARQRPDELSGGLRQRALIASALALDPEIIIADEPTTALDVTVQAQVLTLLAETKERGVSVILISHDLSVVAHLADHILVMQGGRVVESGSADQVLNAPRHEYTRSLINAVPSEATRGKRLGAPAGTTAPTPTPTIWSRDSPPRTAPSPRPSTTSRSPWSEARPSASWGSPVRARAPRPGSRWRCRRWIPGPSHCSARTGRACPNPAAAASAARSRWCTRTR